MTFSPEDKKLLISKLIEMANADGVYRDEEFDFIHSVAREYLVEPMEVDELFDNPFNESVPPREVQRIIIIYLMFKMMLIDGEVTSDEMFVLKDTAMRFGLPIQAINQMLELSRVYKQGDVPIEQIIKAFKVHHN